MQAFINKIFQHILQYPKLQLLNLSFNRKDVIKYVLKTYFVKSQNVRWLCLNGCEDITSSHVETLGANFTGLFVLHMSGCKEVINLPSSISELSSLKELDLRYCFELRSLPDAIGKLVNLQVLILRLCCELKQLPESVGDWCSF